MPRIKQYADRYAMSDLGTHIVGRLKASGMTQQELGAALNVSQQTVSRILKSPENLTLGVLRKICKVVEIDQAVVAKAAWCEPTRRN